VHGEQINNSRQEWGSHKKEEVAMQVLFGASPNSSLFRQVANWSDSTHMRCHFKAEPKSGNQGKAVTNRVTTLLIFLSLYWSIYVKPLCLIIDTRRESGSLCSFPCLYFNACCPYWSTTKSKIDGHLDLSLSWPP